MRLFSIAFVLALGAFSSAQTSAEYLQLRKKHGISAAAGVGALETLVGERVIEVSGLVKGCVSSSEGGYLYLQSLDGSDLTIQSSQPIPQWMRVGDVPARLIIRARRTDEYSALQASLLGAATETSIAGHDRKPAPKPAVKATRTKNLASRSGATRVAGRKWNMAANDALPYYVAFIKNHNKKLSSAEAQRIAEAIIGFSLEFGVDARLIVAMVICESDFRPNLVSSAGARGLGQLMPGTAKGLGVSDPFDVTQNLYGTVKLISGHIGNYKSRTGDDFESLVLSLAAYNAGGGAVRKYGGVPPYRETQNYVKKVIARYNQLCGSD